jgi:hypothetical protein
VLRKVGGRSKICFKPLPGDDPRQRQPDITKAKAMLQWQPTVSLEDGLEPTIAYFRHLLARSKAPRAPSKFPRLNHVARAHLPALKAHRAHAQG